MSPPTVTKDYKKRPAAEPQSGRKIPCWAHFFIGGALGFFVAFLLFLREQGPVHNSNSLSDFSAPAKTTEARGVEKQQRDVPPPPPKRAEPEFDFYKMLPQLEVEVPDVPAPTVDTKHGQAQGNTHATKKPAQHQYQYQLQLASFVSHRDAEAFKAKLAFSGVESHIQKGKAKGKAVFRVMVGPYKSRAKAEKQQRTLRSNKMDSLILRLK